MNTMINRNQYNALLGFYAHCYAVYHDGAPESFAFWASQLDSAEVPMSVQNSVAVAAEDKSSQSQYLSTILSERDITVRWSEVIVCH